MGDAIITPSSGRIDIYSGSSVGFIPTAYISIDSVGTGALNIASASGKISLSGSIGVGKHSNISTPSGSLDIYSGPISISGNSIIYAEINSPIIGTKLQYFGDGSDGNIIINTTGLASGDWLISGSLQRDIYANNLTFINTGKINPNGFKIFVANALDISLATGFAILSSGNSGTLSTSAGGLISRSVGEIGRAHV